MKGGNNRRNVGERQAHLARFAQCDALSQQCEQRGSSERDNYPGPHVRDLGREPRVTRLDLTLGRSLVDATLASWLPAEMLHRIGQVDTIDVDVRRRQHAAQQPAGGPDERQSLPILLVAPLLPTSMIRASRGPSPGTPRVACSHSVRLWHASI